MVSKKTCGSVQVTMRIAQLLQASKNADSLLLQKWQRGTLRAEKSRRH